MNEEMAEPPDHHQYRMVMLRVDTVRFFVSAFDFYIDLLVKEREQINADPYLSGFITEETRREFRIERDLDQAKRIREWLQDKVAEKEEYDDVWVAPDHWTIRFLKSAGILYLSFIKSRRNSLSSQPNISRNTLAAIDREITRKEEILTASGVFAKASTLALLVEQQVSVREVGEESAVAIQPISKTVRPAPVVVDSIEILDGELKRRCLDLFHQFNKSGQPDRNDTVVSEASRILEDRLRTVLDHDGGMTAKQLASLAFNPEKPKLKVSGIKQEQDAVNLLFQGFFGFVRNPVQHKLIETLPPERVLQILGWIDYLLAVINQAEQVDTVGK